MGKRLQSIYTVNALKIFSIFHKVVCNLQYGARSYELHMNEAYSDTYWVFFSLKSVKWFWYCNCTDLRLHFFFRVDFFETFFWFSPYVAWALTHCCHSLFKQNRIMRKKSDEKSKKKCNNSAVYNKFLGKKFKITRQNRRVCENTRKKKPNIKKRVKRTCRIFAWTSYCYRC